MTLVSDIITDAYRESNLIPLVATPNTAQQTEALRRLNALFMSSIGNEIGDELTDINIGGDNDQSEFFTDDIVLDHVRMVLNLAEATTFLLDPNPYDGMRVAVVDSSGDLDLFNLILDGNGRNIEGAPTLTLSTSGTTAMWMYRADTGNWVRMEALETSDEMPFPIDFDDYFVIALALRLNPRYGQTITSESMEILKRQRTQIRARYRRRIKANAFNPLSTIHPWYKTGTWGFPSTSDQFDQGTLWPWS